MVRVWIPAAPGLLVSFFFFQAEDGIRDKLVTGVQTCALPICEPVKELAERLVVVFQLLHIVRLARTAGRVDLPRDAVLVVRVRDVSERDRDPLLLHLRNVGEGRGREQPVKAREARLSELVRDRLA